MAKVQLAAALAAFLGLALTPVRAEPTDDRVDGTFFAKPLAGVVTVCEGQARKNAAGQDFCFNGPVSDSVEFGTDSAGRNFVQIISDNTNGTNSLLDTGAFVTSLTTNLFVGELADFRADGSYPYTPGPGEPGYGKDTAGNLNTFVIHSDVEPVGTQRDVPEPASLMLVGIALAAVGVWRGQFARK